MFSDLTCRKGSCYTR